MKDIKILPGLLKGDIKIPPSKSLCHRAIIAAALAHGQSIISNVVLSEDILATIGGVRALGAIVTINQDQLIIEGCRLESSQNCIIDCNESGSTLRFLMPISLLSNNAVSFVGRGNLSSRPLEPYIEIFKEQDIFYSDTSLPMTIKGCLNHGIFKLKGSISSQFITGLMFALPLLEEDSTVLITEPLESKSYIDLTIDVLNSFGISIINNNYKSFFIKGKQEYKNTLYTVEGDYSQAAFWLAAGALGGDVSCTGLSQNSKQGDRAILQLLKTAGACIEISDSHIKAEPLALQAFEIDISQCPDIAPILAVIAALSEGTSKITGAARLRIKECDRLKAITTELNKLGAQVFEEKDSLTINGMRRLRGGDVTSWGDHRIAMALAIAAIKCEEPVMIHNSNAVDKSYPNFFDDYKMLGGILLERNMG
ncbi:MAG: aroA [Clostridia bacterium]|jgi:3-phosphoshikimate 1-carboxyvinyltransferase|nr:aroA [Clostridia bacterium]